MKAPHKHYEAPGARRGIQQVWWRQHWISSLLYPGHSLWKCSFLETETQTSLPFWGPAEGYFGSRDRDTTLPRGADLMDMVAKLLSHCFSWSTGSALGCQSCFMRSFCTNPRLQHHTRVRFKHSVRSRLGSLARSHPCLYMTVPILTSWAAKDYRLQIPPSPYNSVGKAHQVIQATGLSCSPVGSQHGSHHIQQDQHWPGTCTLDKPKTKPPCLETSISKSHGKGKNKISPWMPCWLPACLSLAVPALASRKKYTVTRALLQTRRYFSMQLHGFISIEMSK